VKVLINILALLRYLVLTRQARELKRTIAALPLSAKRALAKLTLAEIEAASQELLPHLYGSTGTDRYQPWGNATALAFERARAAVPQLKLRGIALWLAVTFHETQDSPRPLQQALHREVLGFLGDLKGTYAAHARAQAIERAAAI